jgi:phospholipase C
MEARPSDCHKVGESAARCRLSDGTVLLSGIADSLRRLHAAPPTHWWSDPPMPRPDQSNALDHIVVLMFENSSFDNLRLI